MLQEEPLVEQLSWSKVQLELLELQVEVIPLLSTADTVWLWSGPEFSQVTTAMSVLHCRSTNTPSGLHGAEVGAGGIAGYTGIVTADGDRCVRTDIANSRPPLHCEGVGGAVQWSATAITFTSYMRPQSSDVREQSVCVVLHDTMWSPEDTSAWKLFLPKVSSQLRKTMPVTQEGTGRWVRGECSQFLNTSYLNDLLNTLSSPPLKKSSITCDNLKRRTGFARTVDSLSDGLDGVGLSTLQHLQDTAAVGGAAGRPLSLGGGGVDCDAHGILVFNPVVALPVACQHGHSVVPPTLQLGQLTGRAAGLTGVRVSVGFSKDGVFICSGAVRPGHIHHARSAMQKGCHICGVTGSWKRGGGCKLYV
ncbi:hypothetical protein F7725_027979 [Dissostichus mawsoni]|uniref:Uncharacterized protein n=1 Tax=Dissostichus mawsoni TaxID=36200 RepID=A0A7J5XEQ6_DISMA|nr:hypothetical protein F7725_027979 [Dissostichus mawsoni]